MIIESKFTDVALDSITDYVLSVKAKKKQANVFECVKYVAEQLQFSIDEVTHAFGDMIKKEVDRVNTATDVIDESAETFSKHLLTEADANAANTQTNTQTNTQANTQAKADTAEKTQTADDKKSDVVRRFFVYANFNNGKMYILSATNDLSNIPNKSLEKLYNFLSKCEKPTFSNGILVAPITRDAALQYVKNGKIELEDLTLRSKATSPKALAKEYY